MNIWQSFKKWALRPEEQRDGAPKPFITLKTEPECDTPYWMRDPEIGEPVKSIMKAFLERPSRFKLTAEWRDRTGGFSDVRGKVTDSVTGESFNYTQSIRIPEYMARVYVDNELPRWRPLTTATRYFLQRCSAYLVISNTDLNVDWMTPRERSLCVSIVKDSYVERIATVIEYETARSERAAKKAEREAQALQDVLNAAERKRLIEIYRGE